MTSIRFFFMDCIDNNIDINIDNNSDINNSDINNVVINIEENRLTGKNMRNRRVKITGTGTFCESVQGEVAEFFAVNKRNVPVTDSKLHQMAVKAGKKAVKKGVSLIGLGGGFFP